MTRVFKSLYPQPPELSTCNYYNFVFSRPEIASWSDWTAFIDGLTGERRTFRSTVARIETAAVALTNLGMVPGGAERIGILSENCMDYPVITLALLKLATPFVLFPAFGTVHESIALVKLSQATCLFVSLRLFPLGLVAAKAAGIPQDRVYLLHGRARGTHNFGDMIVQAKSTDRLATCPVDDRTLAYLVFSSGTSGLPKAVMISHGNLIASALQPIVMGAVVEKLYTPPPLKTDEGVHVSICFTPLYHAMGLHIYILRFFLIPSTTIMIPKWDLNLVLDLIPKYKVTDLVVVPAMAHQLVNSERFNTMDLSNLSLVGSGAAHMPSDLRARFTMRMAIKWYSEGYGLSECTVSAIFAPFPGSFGSRASHVPGMTGVLLPGMEAKILREDGSDTDFGEPGELYLRGKNIALGYWNNEKATKETFFPDGWLKTGDRFKADAEGRFFYIDRVKDTLKVSGVQVAPSEIETVILDHPGRLITDVAVAGVQGMRMADEKIPRAWVVLSDAGKKKGEKAVIQELNAWVKEQLSKPKWLRGGIVVVNEIPKSPTGKVLRRLLVEKGHVRSKL
ncbi:acetyl-CoA synthetase-like protein [Vararia minispora EC-137]|uniref:Acetyl-CoA synthetase-like protein n=1 Tax=Vararia minispora EC-137 TaxID=1314806 RepID=A0ACB8QXN5_9AGAM|nr:acetyl-CoA synthetase-like protein [Vararia minispora EC-137]